MNSLANLFGSESFMPHGHCYYWKPEILWSYVAADIFIALAYYSIPIALIYLVQKRKDLEFNWIFIMFSAFIFACGTTHLISIWTIWQPVYWLDVSAKGFTAAISVITSIMLWHLIPQALRIPSTQELKDTVGKLRHEIIERTEAEAALEDMKNSLELRVEERTAELLEINQQLAKEIEVRKNTEMALFAEKQRAVITLESIGDGVITTDNDANVTYLNPIAEKMTGWTNLQAQQKPLLEVFNIVNESTRKLVPNPVDIVLNHGEIHGLANHTMLISKSGEEYSIEDSAAPIRGSEGKILGVVLVFHDVSESRKMVSKMTYLAEHDFLTGLPNRLLINDRLNQALMSAKRNKEYVALMFLDLDRFKNINDSLGHEIGDEVLKMVAKLMATCLRASDTISRQGGDEFMILLPAMEDHYAPAEVAEKLLAATSQPFEIAGHEIRISVSIGIAVYPDDGDNVEMLTKSADSAMYHAKSLGRNNYQFFTQSMNERIRQLVELENNLRRAVDMHEFFLAYQPKVDINSGEIIGVEALIRWQHPEWGLVSPERFISISEDTGLIKPIGAWVLKEACRQNRQWQDAGYKKIPISVNVSVIQLRDAQFLNELTEILMLTGLEPSYLELEVTESVSMEGEQKTIDLLKSIKELGIRLSIDDFGTGYSSLSYLKKLPIDVIKIDKSFIRDIKTDPDDATIITAIIKMSHGLKLKVIAEGVETQEQLDYLKLEGCDQYQGYLISEPISSEKFTSLLKDKNMKKSLI